MLRDVQLKDLRFSHREPKICAPLCGTSMDEVLWEIRSLKEKPVDLLEWRGDYFNEDILCALPELRKAAEDMPLMFTFRTKKEGGARDCSDYRRLLMAVMDSRKAQLIDIELTSGDETVKLLTAKAKEMGMVSVVSAHFFEHTPPLEDMLKLYEKMEALGGDIPKLAAMPRDFGDVLKLMEASYTTVKENSPIIAISMGAAGGVSRLCPGQIGSAISFAAGKLASAPGQLKAELVRQVLDSTAKSSSKQ